MAFHASKPKHVAIMIDQRRRLRSGTVDRLDLGDDDRVISRLVNVGYAAFQQGKVAFENCVSSFVFVPSADHVALAIMLGKAARNLMLIVRQNVDCHSSGAHNRAK